MVGNKTGIGSVEHSSEQPILQVQCQQRGVPQKDLTSKKVIQDAMRSDGTGHMEHLQSQEAVQAPFCYKDLLKVRRYLGGSICPTTSHMKAQEDHGNPPSAPPPASIPPPPRGVTGTLGPGAAPLPPPPPAWNTLQPQDTPMMRSLPLSSSGSHHFPPPHLPDQVMGGWDSTPSPVGMDISYKQPFAMARGSI